jgi:predicted nucleotidyltransferase
MLPSHVDQAAHDLLTMLLPEIRMIFSAELIGIYLYGSLVSGDFDDMSDIDLMVVSSGSMSSAQFAALDALHQQAVRRFPQWENRLEVAYLPQRALHTFRTESSTIAVISPGEPFHYKEAGNDWLINWYIVREKGLALYGADVRAVIDPISHEEYLASVRRQVLEWGDWVQTVRDHVASQGYAILTMCRALYACTHGEQVSKKRAAQWAMQQYPQWETAIRDAWYWRSSWREESRDPLETFPRTEQFVRFTIEQVQSG